MSVSTIGAVTATTLGTALTAPGATNTKSDWLEISSSTPEACQGFFLELHTGGADADALIDIGTGASSSEVVLVGDIMKRCEGTVNMSNWYYFPVAIAAGTRVAARYQATSTSASVNLVMYLLNNSGSIVIGSMTPVTYGINTADSGATGIDPGGTINTKPATFTEITNSTSADIDYVVVMIGNRNNTAVTSASWMVDIATGASSSESVVIANVRFHTRAEVDMMDFHCFGPFPVTIASGTRLSARAQCDTNDATDRLIDIAIVGLNGAAAAGGSSGAHFSAAFGA